MQWFFSVREKSHEEKGQFSRKENFIEVSALYN